LIKNEKKHTTLGDEHCGSSPALRGVAAEAADHFPHWLFLLLHGAVV
jgi:hypothetical protein